MSSGSDEDQDREQEQQQEFAMKISNIANIFLLAFKVIHLFYSLSLSRKF